jgi:23S rRNA (adenine2030-N6)-methyltransferase
VSLSPRRRPRYKIVAVDGWTALNVYVPPKERRGLVLVDPPFEADNDFSRLASGLAAAPRKGATGVYIFWCPIKGRSEADAFAKRLRRLALNKVLRAEIFVAPLRDPSRLNGAGMVIVNPPWTLESELCALLPVPASIFGEGTGRVSFDWLAGEEPSAPQ